MTKKELKELLILCTKNIHFTFGAKTFVPSGRVAIGTPLGQVLADIFMVELENTLVPTLTEYMNFCKRYVDDTICFVKMRSVEYMVSILNSFGANVQLVQNGEKVSFTIFRCFTYKKWK